MNILKKFLMVVSFVLLPGVAFAVCDSSNDCNVNTNTPSQTTTVSVRPAASAPSIILTSVGSDNCLGSASGSVGNGFFSVGGGATTESVECNRRAYSRRLQELGQKEAAINLLCMNPEVALVTPACANAPKPTLAKTGAIVSEKDPIVCARTGERC